MTRSCLPLVVLGLVATAPAAAQVPVDLLPDIITNSTYLLETELRGDIEPGRILLTLSNATPNIGDGPLEVYGDTATDGELEVPVKQRIHRSDGSYYDRDAGVFAYHASHDHIHLKGWARYRLRDVLDNDGVGPVTAQSKKTSYCLLDSLVYDLNLPGAPPSAHYVTCDFEFQGISVGYQDLYDKSLPDQWIDVTDVPDGTYWLESEADPANHILEKDETNNVARVKVTIDRSTLVQPPGPNPLGIIAILVALFQRLLEILQALFGLR